MTDLEQRAQKLLDDIASRRNKELADEIFRESKQREAQKEMQEREEMKKLKRKEELWNPYLEKAMKRVEQEKQEHDKLMEKLRK